MNQLLNLQPRRHHHLILVVPVPRHEAVSWGHLGQIGWPESWDEHRPQTPRERFTRGCEGLQPIPLLILLDYQSQNFQTMLAIVCVWCNNDDRFCSPTFKKTFIVKTISCLELVLTRAMPWSECSLGGHPRRHTHHDCLCRTCSRFLGLAVPRGATGELSLTVPRVNPRELVGRGRRSGWLGTGGLCSNGARLHGSRCQVHAQTHQPTLLPPSLSLA